ncbi:MAG: hypothetical protein ACRC8S_07445 [Fimbriiglobus sp.]
MVLLSDVNKKAWESPMIDSLEVLSVRGRCTLRLMMIISLLLNVVVLVPVCGGLIGNAAWAVTAYGQDSPARRILLSVYITIGVASLVLLLRPTPAAVATVLALQVVYKMISPMTVGTLANPVVVSNVVIAVFHLVTLAVMWWGGAWSVPSADEALG